MGTSGPSDERTDWPDGTEKLGPWFSRKDTGGAALCGVPNEPKTLSKSLWGPSRAKPEGDMVFSAAGWGVLRKNGLVLWLVVEAAGLTTAGVWI